MTRRGEGIHTDEGWLTGCVGKRRSQRLWPPNHKLVHVADISATNALSVPPRLVVSAEAGGGAGDVVINGGSVDLRAETDRDRRTRTYRLRVAAVDNARNTATA